jgi:hypothetical protein
MKKGREKSYDIQTGRLAWKCKKSMIGAVSTGIIQLNRCGIILLRPASL